MKYKQLNSSTTTRIYITDNGELWTTYKIANAEQAIIEDENVYKKYISVGTDGYQRTKIGHIYRSVHRLVAKSFVDGESDERIEVNHIDGNKLNNCADNLEWVSKKDNIAHALMIGLIKSRVPETLIRWNCEYCGKERKNCGTTQCVRESNEDYIIAYKNHGRFIKNIIPNPKSVAK